MKSLNLHWDDDRVRVWRSASSKPRVGIQVRLKGDLATTASTYISRRSAKILHDWLEAYLKETVFPENSP